MFRGVRGVCNGVVLGVNRLFLLWFLRNRLFYLPGRGIARYADSVGGGGAEAVYGQAGSHTAGTCTPCREGVERVYLGRI